MRVALLSLVLPFSLVLPAVSAEKSAPDAEAAIAKGIDFLKTAQADDGSYSAQSTPAITAMATYALLQNGRSPDDPQVAKGLKYLENLAKADGGIYRDKSRLPNYETCICIVCLSAANKDGRYAKLLGSAEKYVKGLQTDVQGGKAEESVNYGGSGYDGKSRPDLSNTAMLMDALEAAGDSSKDEAVQRALIFVSRCQNLETANTITKFAAKNPDGGFFYSPAGQGESKAGKTDEGALRSQGSMTYAGLKSMVFAGLTADDPRVKAALSWAKKNYTTEENPGMGQSGVYYYYHLMAKSLAALKQDTFGDAQGVKHDWRKELAAELVKRQKPDGSWSNTNKQFMENDANLATSFALLTLAYCKDVK